MLIRAVNPEKGKIDFGYDPLGRRTTKIVKNNLYHYLWAGNVVLHEWLETKEEARIKFVTWIYEDGSFIPVAKLLDNENYSIVSDYLGTPTHAYGSDGSLVWERELDIYGRPRKGDNEFIPFLYQGQYFDKETGLAYNRFRYYDPSIGSYISQDPIGLMGSNPNEYAYVNDPNTWIDVFGLDCSSDAAKLRKNMQAEGVMEPGYKNSAHHIIMSNSKDPRMVSLRKKMKQLGIDKNAAANGAYLPTSSKVKKAAKTNAHPHSKVHTDVYKQNVFNRLKDINNKADFEDELMNISDELSAGTFKI